MVEQPSAYARAGVDIDAATQAKTLMKEAVQATYGPEVLSTVGSFGGMYAASQLNDMAEPVLVASTDGVGTKTMVAARVGRWDSIGRDIVNHCVNDILVQGAQPLFFLDYVASSRLDPEQIATVVRGIAAACRDAGCALLGGETAEMPGVYQPGELDLVGTIVGVVERAAIIDGSRIQPGDVVLGLPSRGLHTNGYTLARTALARLDWEEPLAELNASIGEALLAPHRSYLPAVRALWRGGIDLRGLAHITGGGLLENPPRILPAGTRMVLDPGRWQTPPIFALIQRHGGVSDEEMARVFNLGLGMLAVIPRADIESAQRNLPEAILAGEIAPGNGEVTLAL
jgi:phosphoribosylformylglycinamidine cyclo-ligase